MKIPVIVPTVFCMGAGVLLVGRELFSQSPEAMGTAIGLYFIGKGLFIYAILSALPDLKQHR